MRIAEILAEDTGIDPNANLMTVLQFLRSRSIDKNVSLKLSTNSLINMVKNTGQTSFSYDDLVRANTNPAVKNLIKNFNRDEIVLASELDGTPDISNPNANMSPEDTVSGMSKRALNKRS